MKVFLNGHKCEGWGEMKSNVDIKSREGSESNLKLGRHDMFVVNTKDWPGNSFNEQGTFITLDEMVLTPDIFRDLIDAVQEIDFQCVPVQSPQPHPNIRMIAYRCMDEFVTIWDKREVFPGLCQSEKPTKETRK